MKSNIKKENQTKMQKLFPEYYGQKVILKDHDYMIDFDPDEFHKTVGAEKLTYDEYLDIQMKSSHEVRVYFKTCYYNIPLGFKGRIERRTKNNICFKRIFVEGMFPDGVCFDGKEEHVWMSNAQFEKYKIGDCVSFFAEVYRYVKTSNGKQIDFALRNPENIKRIKPYEPPSDKELFLQVTSRIVCDNCYLNEHCNKTYCIRKL